MQVDFIQLFEAVGGVGGIGGVGWFGRWLIGRVQRMESENSKAHEECRKKNTELELKIGVIEKRSYDTVVADRTLLITTLQHNTAAVEKNSGVLEKFSTKLIDRTPPGGSTIKA